MDFKGSLDWRQQGLMITLSWTSSRRSTTSQPKWFNSRQRARMSIPSTMAPCFWTPRTKCRTKQQEKRPNSTLLVFSTSVSNNLCKLSELKMNWVIRSWHWRRSWSSSTAPRSKTTRLFWAKLALISTSCQAYLMSTYLVTSSNTWRNSFSINCAQPFT